MFRIGQKCIYRHLTLSLRQPEFVGELFCYPPMSKNPVDESYTENEERQLIVLIINQLPLFFCEPVGSRTPIEGTGILYSIH